MRSALRSHLFRYALAILAVALALTLRFVLQGPLEPVSPFRLFAGAVMLAAAFAGFGPGILSVVLSCLIVNYFFMQADGKRGFDFSNAPPDYNLVRMLAFAAEGIVISILSGLLRSARTRAEASEEALRQDQLIRERLERQILEVSDHERQLVGGDLHDGLGQHLTGIAFMSKLLCRKLADRGASEVKEATKVLELVNQSIAWTRDIARGLAPVELVRRGLPGALDELAGRAREMFNVDCRYHGDEIALDEARAVHVYRIAQEAVTNAVKHGKAKQVNIDLKHEGGTITMTVTDDGKGFQPLRTASVDESGKPPKKPGLGLQMMTYRARMIGGTLNITPRQGGGTVLACRLPAETNQETPEEESGDAPQNENASAPNTTSGTSGGPSASPEQQPHVA